jgi:HlyD family secretion protein
MIRKARNDKEAKVKVMKRFALPFVGIVLVFGLVWQVSPETLTHAIKRPHVTSTQTKVESKALTIRTEGRVVAYPNAEVNVGTDVAGTITYLPVKEKDYVRKGQVIAELRSDDLRASMNSAQAHANEAVADMKLYEVEVERARKLYEGKVGTLQALDRAQRDLDAARARLNTANADVKRWEATIAKTRIVAPISGTVIMREVAPGETLKEGATLMKIADLSKVRVEAEVDEFDTGRIHRGGEALVSAEGFAGHSWKSRIEEIPNSVVPRNLRPEDPGKPVDTRVLLVKLAFEGKTPLKLGQRVQVEIQPEEQESTVAQKR